MTRKLLFSDLASGYPVVNGPHSLLGSDPEGQQQNPLHGDRGGGPDPATKGTLPPACDPSHHAVEPQAILEISEEGQELGAHNVPTRPAHHIYLGA